MKDLFGLESIPKVYNKHHKNFPSSVVYVGRPTPWGNPFNIGEDGTRKEVVEKFRKLVESDEGFQKEIKRNLQGKDLLCFCAPQECHADILLEYANKK